ncbi:MAG: peptidylprolyl isomerase [Myxococcales bacterium]|nr:peptidylprolyl isomerase [Myxococcales bacterium]
MSLRAACLLGFAVLAFLPRSLARAEDETPATIQAGNTVSIEFTLTLDDGTVVESSSDRGRPFVYQHGSSDLPPALEGALAGMGVGQEKKITLAPEDAYGAVDSEAFRTVPLDALPEGAREPGAQLVTSDPEGNPRPVRVHEVRVEEAVIDLNHPLAGQTVHFEIRVLAVD